jgi:hypothetical protein
MRFHVLTAASMMITAFWDIAPRIVVEVDPHFIELMMEAVSTSETSV